MKSKAVILSALALLTSALPVAPHRVEAATTPRIPLTCGMELIRDTYVYLTKNLTCSTEYGVIVRYAEGEECPCQPNVTVDLRGFTLRGTGSGTGVMGLDWMGGQRVLVKNGRIANWDVGVWSQYDMRIKNVELLNNRVGFLCGEHCNADQVVFRGSKEGGMVYGEGPGASVTRSLFIGNAIGAQTQYIYRLTVDQSTFLYNGVGISAYHQGGVAVIASRSTFIANGIAIRVQPTWEFDDPCAALSKIVYIKNGKNFVGRQCLPGEY